MSDDIRETVVAARSTDTFGRVLASARHHHVVVDGPVQNGCPGEALTPPELFLGGIAACAVELIGVIARDRGTPLQGAGAVVRGRIDRSDPVRRDVSVFNEVHVDIELRGVGDQDAAALVEGFKSR